MVPQEPMLFPNMTVREHHHWFFEAPKKARLNKMLEDTMKRDWLELDLDRKAMTLSIAERGGLRFSAVLCVAPRFLFWTSQLLHLL